MQGRPVWLASVSRRESNGRIIPNTRWDRVAKKKATRFLDTLLLGIGDERHGWRLFRMNITYCLHRAVSDDELDQLPTTWRGEGTALAGGPVAVLGSGNCEVRPSVLPCVSPTKVALPGMKLTLDGFDPDLWFPMDCGKCAPCEDRAAIEQAMANDGG